MRCPKCLSRLDYPGAISMMTIRISHHCLDENEKPIQGGYNRVVDYSVMCRGCGRNLLSVLADIGIEVQGDDLQFVDATAKP